MASKQKKCSLYYSQGKDIIRDLRVVVISKVVPVPAVFQDTEEGMVETAPATTRVDREFLTFKSLRKAKRFMRTGKENRE